MASNVFGKDISRVFFPLEDDEPLNLPSQSPALYLFEGKPNYTDAAAGTGSIQSKTYWTHDESSPFPRSYVWDAVDDPAPSSQSQARTYWEALNFRTQATEQVQTLLRALVLERVEELDSSSSTSVQDIKNAYPGISNYLSDAQIENQLENAHEELKTDLEGRGIKWSRIYDLHKTKLALNYKVISLSALTQVRETGDKHDRRFDIYDTKYTAIMKLITLPVDNDGDGSADGVVDTNLSTFINLR